jgi:Fur family transcriptional regulator, ferric uptake regulator
MQKDLKSVLREKGSRATPARLALLGVLSAAPRPLSMSEIRKAIPKKKADQATLYRTLELLLAQNIVQPVNFRHRHAHYELDKGYHHHHLICYRCGEVEDFEECGIEEIAKRALSKSKKFAGASDHALEIFGLCIKCAKA